MGKLVKYTHLLVVYYMEATAIIDTIDLLVCVDDLLTAISLSMKPIAENICFQEMTGQMIPEQRLAAQYITPVTIRQLSVVNSMKGDDRQATNKSAKGK